MPAHGPDHQRPFPIVSQAMTCILHRKCVQKRESFSIVLRWHKRRLHRPQQVHQIVFCQLSSIINMSDKVLFIYNPDTVAGMLCIYFKYPVLLVIIDLHEIFHSFFLKTFSVLLSYRFCTALYVRQNFVFYYNSIVSFMEAYYFYVFWHSVPLCKWQSQIVNSPAKKSAFFQY